MKSIFITVLSFVIVLSISVPQVLAQTAKVIYEVQKNDTLSEIAINHKVSVSRLYNQNKKIIGSNPNLIIIGLKIIIPDKTISADDNKAVGETVAKIESATSSKPVASTVAIATVNDIEKVVGISFSKTSNHALDKPNTESFVAPLNVVRPEEDQNLHKNLSSSGYPYLFLASALLAVVIFRKKPPETPAKPSEKSGRRSIKDNRPKFEDGDAPIYIGACASQGIKLYFLLDQEFSVIVPMNNLADFICVGCKSGLSKYFTFNLSGHIDELGKALKRETNEIIELSDPEREQIFMLASEKLQQTYITPNGSLHSA